MPQRERRSLDDDQVMTFQEWCEINDISTATGERLIAAGQGPRFIRLSTRRKGITRRENRRWQQSRQIESAA
jgi:predicted site-specific integrase-resolvase